MPRSLLPPRGIEIPTALLYNRNVSPAVRDTWAQLRGLAWGQNETPELSAKYLSEMLNKSQSTVYEHMRLLRVLGCLSWLTTEKKGIIVRFPETDFINSILSEKSESDGADIETNSEFSEKPPLLNTSSTNTYSNVGGIKEIPNFRKVGMENRRKPDTVPAETLRPIIDALADVTNTDKMLNYGRLAREAKALHLAGYTVDQVIKAYGVGGRWYSVDWRGMKGEPPDLGAIRSTIKAILAANITDRRNGSKPSGPAAARPDTAKDIIQRRREKLENGN